MSNQSKDDTHAHLKSFFKKLSQDFVNLRLERGLPVSNTPPSGHFSTRTNTNLITEPSSSSTEVEKDGVPIALNSHEETGGHIRFPKILESPPDPEGFRSLIDEHVPVLILGCLQDRNLVMQRWKSSEYLLERMDGRKVKVALTPDGRADDLIELRGSGERGGSELGKVFALPLEVDLDFGMFLGMLEDQSSRSAQDRDGGEGEESRGEGHGGDGLVAYLQSQNSNLENSQFGGDLSPLLEDLCVRTFPDGETATGQGDGVGESAGFEPGGNERRSDLIWASEAIGSNPEATNIWIGTSRSRTSMHRDFYENLFTVVRGWKEFTLYPPNEGIFLCDDEQFPIYKYEPVRKSISEEGEDGELSSIPKRLVLQPTGMEPTRWIPIDPSLGKSHPRNKAYIRSEDRAMPVLDSANEDDFDDPRVEESAKRFGFSLEPIKIRVHEGETLYLPSGWYHHVAQEEDSSSGLGQGLCLCLNWWYEITDDMAVKLADSELQVDGGQEGEYGGGDL
ncbi:Clavaminate synthase-like protein [Violaceomyces palustris]|uniref:Clavaminate synthase-like protein n=1 Tax=Violaceomyces palustris TaxID=1673888 RepID=A0ACD0NVT7_9BASI|nr:Clavaminate synthase-like protein [Violaceomyces palustris]